MESSHHENDNLRVLYDSSYTGCVSTLDELLRDDQLILHRISQTTFPETPLHISALRGDLDFTKKLLTHKRQLARELDSSRSTALHLASAEGHEDIVKELLKAYGEACLVGDQEGRIPLHYAAMRGRLEVVRALIREKPESVTILNNGKSVLHLCVAYNQLEILKALVEMKPHTNELLNLRDLDGRNTILHLAIMFKQVETTRYLLSIPEIREAASLEKEMGFRAHDIMERSPKDWKSLEIQLMLMKAGITHPQPPSSSSTVVVDQEASTVVVVDQEARPPKKNFCRTIMKCMGKWFSSKHKGDWLEEMRGNLSLVSTVISTITFQGMINPPGGVIQQLDSSSSSNSRQTDPLDCFENNGIQVCPGSAMFGVQDPDHFFAYLVCNTISFIASLSVTLLLVSGLSLKKKPFMWMLSVLMCITLTFLTATYVIGVILITNNLSDTYWKIIQASVLIWEGLCGLIVVLLVMRFFIWLLKKCFRIIKHVSRCLRNENGSCWI